MIQPETEWIAVTKIYSQAAVANALGITIAENDILRIHCDGDNKVRVEVWQNVQRIKAMKKRKGKKT